MIILREYWLDVERDITPPDERVGDAYNDYSEAREAFDLMNTPG
jgi:hypothetical protein